MKEINQKRLVKHFIELTEIDSPSFQEREMADYLQRELKRLAVVVHEDDSAERIGGNSGNIYGCLPAKGRRKGEAAAPLLFLAHMDTVEPARFRKAILHDDGRITSDGSTVLGADDQAALAVLLEVIQELQEENAEHPELEFLFAAAEEAYTVGASAMDLSVFKAKEAFALDLSDETGGYSVQEPTLISFTINVHGKASHAGFDPEAGINAIAAAAKAIAKISQGRINDHSTFNIGMIQGGKGTNIIPEQVVVRGELRCTVHEEALNMYDDAVRVFKDEAEAAGASVTAEKTVHLKAYHVDPDDPALLRYQKAAGTLNIPVFPVKTFGGSDVNVLRRNGIAGLCISGAMHNVHTTAEYTTVKELTEAAAIVKEIMTAQYR